MRAYSMDLRERVLTDSDGGMTTKAVAEKYAVSRSWVRRLKQRRTAKGQVGPTEQKRGRTAGWVTYADPIRDAVREAPDATLAEALPRAVSASSVLGRSGPGVGRSRSVAKKRRSGRPSRTGRT